MVLDDVLLYVIDLVKDSVLTIYISIYIRYISYNLHHQWLRTCILIEMHIVYEWMLASDRGSSPSSCLPQCVHWKKKQAHILRQTFSAFALGHDFRVCVFRPTSKQPASWNGRIKGENWDKHSTTTSSKLSSAYYTQRLIFQGGHCWFHPDKVSWQWIFKCASEFCLLDKI